MRTFILSTIIVSSFFIGLALAGIWSWVIGFAVGVAIGQKMARDYKIKSIS